MNDTTLPDPFVLENPPTSPGRVLLARAFAHWCVLHHGYTPAEVGAALRDDPDVEQTIRLAVAGAAQLLGSLLASARLTAWARPIGGGAPERITSDAWELDDFRPTFATGAICPERPFDAAARRTHWVFVDAEEFDELVALSCDDVLRGQRPRRAAAIRPELSGEEGGPVLETGHPTPERHVRLPELKVRTGLSRSTIYSRMGEGRFPRTIPSEGNIAVWRESEIAAWLADPS